VTDSHSIATSWQFLSNNSPGGNLNAGNLGKYDQLVQACLSTGAYCMIDIHNFARFNNAIIGQGGPSDDDFAGLWSQLATKYAGESKIVFELMNEPHDLDIATWAATCQKAVTSIRAAGATSQMILLPGTNFDSAATLVSSGSADALMAVSNPDGSTDGLLLDIHKYLDIDNSGTHAQCVTDNTGNFSIVADYLRGKGRQGFISETGASSDSSCMTAFCAQNSFINDNSDVFVGLVAWGAGSFDTSYVLSLTPSKSGNKFTDNQLMSQCVLATWKDSKDVASSRPPTSTTALGSTAVKSLPPATGTDSTRTASASVTTLTGTAEASGSGKLGYSTDTPTNTSMGSFITTLHTTDTLLPSALMTTAGSPSAGGNRTTGGTRTSAASATTTLGANAPKVTASQGTVVKTLEALLFGGILVAVFL